jgi:hypothetical protein
MIASDHSIDQGIFAPLMLRAHAAACSVGVECSPRNTRAIGAHVPLSRGSTSPRSIRSTVVSSTPAKLASSARERPLASLAGRSDRGSRGSSMWSV